MVMQDASTFPGNSSISQTIEMPMVHVEQCGMYSWCRKEVVSPSTVALDYRLSNCPECLKNLLESAYYFIDDEVRRPIQEFLVKIGDAREFAAESEIEALARIILKHPELWEEENKLRRQRMIEEA
jgi:hypothetical protein